MQRTISTLLRSQRHASALSAQSAVLAGILPGVQKYSE